MKSIVFASLLISHFSTGVFAWGANGHQAVGYVAMEFLAPKAKAFVVSSLGTTYSQSLGPAATWADTIKSQSAYSWSSALHYIDAIDNPPSSCSVLLSRDCPAGDCILSAIANYTTRVVDTKLSAAQRQEALKFLDHFIGDLGQPLHVENVARGGNDISITCNGTTTNLHSFWDSGILDSLLKTSYGNSVTTWATALATRIKTGNFKSLAGSWISCTSTTQPASRAVTSGASIQRDIENLQARAITSLECPFIWAEDSNAIDCSYVFTYKSGTDLCKTTYASNAYPVIELQIAKQGYRLAGWLNALFDGDVSLP